MQTKKILWVYRLQVPVAHEKDQIMPVYTYG